MKTSSVVCLVTVVATFAGSMLCANPGPRYVFTDLGDLPRNSDSKAVAINNLGQVIVQTRQSTQSLVWIPDKPNGTTGTFWDLGTIQPDHVDPEFGTETVAFDINDKGEIVGVSGSGWHYKGARSARPFRTRIGKKLDRTCIMMSKNGGSTPYAINNRGIVAGALEDASTSHATKWSSDGRGVSLGKLHAGDKDCAAYAINDLGTIAGTGLGHAWVLTGMHKRDLGEGVATAVNNCGVVTGMSQQRACIWVGSKLRLLDRAHYRPGV